MPHRPLPTSATLTALAAATLLLLTTPATAAATWQITPTPNPSNGVNRFNGLTARTPTDAWAVGSFTGPDGDEDGQQMLTARWNGTQWQQVPAPAVLRQDEVLNAAAATAANDAWAVGVTRNLNAAARSPLATHWNGTTWTIVAIPNTTGSAKSMLNGVAALTPTNAWAVGRGKDAHALIEHWDGTTWTITPTPTPTPPPGWTFTGATLNAVTARTSTDIWAVGSFTSLQNTTSRTRTLALHYNGTTWQITPTPTTAIDTDLTATTALAANDVWTVGTASTINGTTPPDPLVIQHWNGTAWTTVAHPAVTGGRLKGIAARSSGDIWAVGDFFDNTTTTPTGGTLTLHWDGTAWTKVASPNGSSGSSLLNAASATPSDVWAVGFDVLGSNTYRTLALRNTP